MPVSSQVSELSGICVLVVYILALPTIVYWIIETFRQRGIFLFFISFMSALFKQPV